MKNLRELAADLAPLCDPEDLRRLRSMSEADFVMLLAMHRTEEIELAKIISEHGEGKR